MGTTPALFGSGYEYTSGHPPAGTLPPRCHQFLSKASTCVEANRSCLVLAKSSEERRESILGVSDNSGGGGGATFSGCRGWPGAARANESEGWA